ncbi:putative oxidoreductase [Penicillium rolfsii]|nr:putative oxidoreductase [Penicillium rolfsii]
MPKSIAIIAGAGPGTGAAIARRFAAAYPVVLLARSPATLDPLVRDIEDNGGRALAIPTDVTDASSLSSAMNQITSEFGADLGVQAAIYNVASKFMRTPFLEQSPEDFSKTVNLSINGAFNFAQAVLPIMTKQPQGPNQYPPTLIFTGATAALKGGSGLSAFAMSKFGIRAMAQSLAREFGPKGIHVSHAIIDGIIDTEKTKAFASDVPDAKIHPNAIAETYWFLHTQPRNSFTHEIDLRPGVENW